MIYKPLFGDKNAKPSIYHDMTKRDIIFLSLPSCLFVALAAITLYYANDFSPDPQDKQRIEKNIADVKERANKGEFGTGSDRLVDNLASSWHSRYHLHEALGAYHAKTAKMLGGGILIGVALQIYVIFRVRARLKKTNVVQSLDSRFASGSLT
jgi:hypothetical protein